MPIFLNNSPNLKTTFANCGSLAPSAGILLLGIMSPHILTPQEVSGTLSSISRIWEIGSVYANGVLGASLDNPIKMTQ